MNWKAGIVGLLAFALLLQGVAAANLISIGINPGEVPIKPIHKPIPKVPPKPVIPDKGTVHPTIKNPLAPEPAPPKINPGQIVILNNTTQGTPIKVPLPWVEPQPPKRIHIVALPR